VSDCMSKMHLEKRGEDHRLISLKIQTPDGTIIESSQRHKPAFHEDKNGQLYMVDYDTNWPRIQSDGNHINLSVHDDSPFELVRDAFTWGSYGKDGKESLRFIKLKDLSDEHIKSIIDGGHSGMNEYLFKMELEYREI